LEELCKIDFAIAKAGSGNRSEATLVIPCSELAPIVGKTAQPGREGSAENVSKAITEHLYQMPVSVTAQLACTALAFQELASIRPYDILLLDKAVDEPIELIVEGRTLFRGRPAKSAGQYAVVITESVGNRIKT
jgi:flagellar motor switch protein FliM